MDIAAECRKYEEEMGGRLGRSQDRLSGYTQFVLRAYRLTDAAWVGRTVRDFEASFGGTFRGQPEPGWLSSACARTAGSSSRSRIRCWLAMR